MAKRAYKKRAPYSKKDFDTASSVGNLPSLIQDLTSTIDVLERQLTAQIDRLKSILS